MLGCAATIPGSVRPAYARPSVLRTVPRGLAARAQVADSNEGQEQEEPQEVQPIKKGDPQHVVPLRRNLVGDMFNQMQRDLDDMSDFLGMPRFPGRRFGLLDPFDHDFGFERRPLRAAKRMSMDVKETADSYSIEVDVPGVHKDNVKVQLRKGNVLEISAERKSEKSATKDDVVYQERSFGTLQRRLKLPDNIDSDGIQARCEDGILTVTVPKTEKDDDSRTITIE